MIVIPAAYSNDIRKSVINARKEGISISKIVSIFGVKKSSVYGWLKKYTKTGDYTALLHNAGRKSNLTEDDLAKIVEKIHAEPDITLEELKEELNLPICISGLCRIVNKKLKLRYKKTLHAIEQSREDVKTKRVAWKEEQNNLEISKLVFLDESGINTGMTHLYGRGHKGDRAVDYTPDVRFQRTSILSSVRLDGSCVSMVFS